MNALLILAAGLVIGYEIRARFVATRTGDEIAEPSAKFPVATITIPGGLAHGGGGNYYRAGGSGVTR